MAKINQIRGPKTVPDNIKYNPKAFVANISERDLNSLIFHQGVRVKVYKTLWCPNIKSIDGAEHNISCPLCKGTEFLDVDPSDTFCFLQGQEKEYQINPENIGNQWEEQTSMASFISGVELSYYTKVELVDYTHIYKQLVQRQVTGQDLGDPFTPTSYTASTGVVAVPNAVDLSVVRINDVFVDSLGNRFVIIKDIVNTTGSKKFTIDINKTVNLAPGAVITRPDVDRLQFKALGVDVLIDNIGTRYYIEQDFVINRNGDIEWLSTGNKPADKSFYTVYYDTLVAYRAIRALHSTRYGTDQTKKEFAETIEYPQQWILKKLFLFHKEDSESGQKLDPNKIFPAGG